MSNNFNGKFIDFGGADETAEVFKRLPQAANKRVLRASMIAGGRIVLKDAKRRVPRLTGGLAKSLAVRTTKRTGGAAVRVVVGALRPAGAHAHLVEFGTRTQAAQPFLRPAADTQASAVLEKIRDTMGIRLVAEANKIAGPFLRSGLARHRSRRRRRRR